MFITPRERLPMHLSVCDCVCVCSKLLWKVLKEFTNFLSLPFPSNILYYIACDSTAYQYRTNGAQLLALSVLSMNCSSSQRHHHTEPDSRGQWPYTIQKELSHCKMSRVEQNSAKKQRREHNFKPVGKDSNNPVPPTPKAPGPQDLFILWPPYETKKKQ